MMTLDSLREILDRYSRTAVLESDEFKVLVLERGARVLGIFTDAANLLWVNPNPVEVLEKDDWNIGGLRTWISPERNFFYKNPEEFSEWFCPKGIDPGDYRIIDVDDGKVSIMGEISAHDYFIDTDLKGFVMKEIRVAESGKDWLRLRIRDTMEIEYPSRVNPWILAQVPISYKGAGTVLVPVRKNAEPIHYFAEIPRGRITTRPDHIAFKIDGEMSLKLGVKPEDLRHPGIAEVSYLYRVKRGVWGAVMLRSSNSPLSQADCLDTPKLNPNLPRAAIQSYNSGPDTFPGVKFGEIELQLEPALKLSDRLISDVIYDLIAIVGGRERVLAEVRRMLKVKKLRIY